MIRLVSGDRARWVDEPCRAAGPTRACPGAVRPVRRHDIVRGENICPSAIEDTLRAIATVGGEFRILVEGTLPRTELKAAA
jgi:phenylacetate-coenzyme A ligase PaaK-like adenylate-forming protein